jgi:hypothetical protein
MIVIPESAKRLSGIQYFERLLDPSFRRYDEN